MAKFYELRDGHIGATLLSSALITKNITHGYAELRFKTIGTESVPMLVGFGPLGGEYPLLLLEGVGFLGKSGGTSEFVIWKTGTGDFCPGVQLDEDPGYGVIRMDGELPDGTRSAALSIRFSRNLVRVRFLVDGEASSSEQLTDRRDLRVWPERVVRFADARGFYVVPFCPVRREVWPYVKSCCQIAGLEHGWEVRFLGEQELRYNVPTSDDDRWASIGKIEADGTVRTPKPVAMWPAMPLHRWRLYTAMLDQDTVDTDDNVEFWGGIATNSPTCKRMRHKRCNSEIVAIEVEAADAENGIAPVYMVLNKDKGSGPGGVERAERAGGVFQVLPPETPVRMRDAARTIALDVGTSTTVVATLNPDGASRVGPVDLARPAHTTRPFVLVSNVPTAKPAPVLTLFPWLPTVSAGCMIPDENLVEIPTGLFVASAKHDLDYPFADFTFAGPSLDLLAGDPQRQAGRWHPNLKWAVDADVQGHRRLEAFVSAILLWVVGLYRSDSNNFTLRATYPLAFDPQRRERYASMLARTCDRVEKWTGVNLVTSVHWSGQHGDHPFCDESVALVERCVPYLDKMKRIVSAGVASAGPLDEGFVQIMFHADLGGETLDALLAVIEGTSFKILSAESTRVGADVLRSNLAHKTQISREDIKEAVISRLIRIGKLDAELERVLRDGATANDSWDGIPGVNWGPGVPSPLVGNFQQWCEVYAVILLEYCARFIAGNLLDRESLEFRIRKGPGRGRVEGIDWSKGALIAVRRSGNGWKFLKERWSGWSDEAWLLNLAGRIKEFLGSTLDKVLISWDREEMLLPKHIAAVGALGLVEERQRLEGEIPPDAAPNGFDDKDRSGREAVWWMQVGPGSTLGAAAVGTAPVSARALLQDRRHHVSNLLQPVFPAVSLFLTAGARERWKISEANLSDDDRRNIVQEAQERAAAARNVQYRAKSAASAYWELVLAKRVSNSE